jgi:hypothetical protein
MRAEGSRTGRLTSHKDSLGWSLKTRDVASSGVCHIGWTSTLGPIPRATRVTGPYDIFRVKRFVASLNGRQREADGEGWREPLQSVRPLTVANRDPVVSSDASYVRDHDGHPDRRCRRHDRNGNSGVRGLSGTDSAESGVPTHHIYVVTCGSLRRL